MSLVLIGTLSKELAIDRKTIIRWAKENDCLLETKNRNSGKGGGQHAFAVSVENAEKMRAFLDKMNFLVTKLKMLRLVCFILYIRFLIWIKIG